MNNPIILHLLFLFLLISTSQSTCRLYLAPSQRASPPAADGTPTTPTITFGLFAGVPIPSGSVINHPEIAIDVIETKTIGSLLYGGADDGSKLFIPGVGSLSNYAPESHNINAQLVHGQIPEDVIVEEETNDGKKSDSLKNSYTEYYNATIIATEDIPATAEIFFKMSKDTHEALAKASDAVKKVRSYLKDLGDDVTDDMRLAVWNLIRDHVLETDVASFLPPGDTWDKISDELNKWVPGSMDVDAKYLETYGFCLDGVRAGVSTMASVGKGAFSTVALSKGDIVMPVPVKPLRREDLRINNQETGVKETYELILNYCYGRPDSDLLLLPYAPVISYINHYEDVRNRSDRMPNVELRFVRSTYRSYITPGDWMKMSPDDVIEKAKTSPMLMYEIVALTDIQPGDELFMDYGAAWTKAMNDHTKNWISNYMSVTVRNARKTAGEPFRTDQEEPYPPLVYFGCFVDLGDMSQLEFSWKMSPNLLKDDNMYFCVVTKREKAQSGYLYTVKIDFSDGDVYVVDGVPSSAIWFIEDEGSNKNVAFRHEIVLNDHLFSQTWKTKS